MIEPLKFAYLNWQNDKTAEFKYPRMVHIETIADGSCFFHAIANAFFLPYWTYEVKIGNHNLSKSVFIRKMRNDLAARLGDPAPNGLGTNYDQLSNGELGAFAKATPDFDYTLARMQSLLRSPLSVDYVYYEFISNQLNKDIYILSMKHKDVCPVDGDSTLLYKNRESIVLLYQRGHYELVGLSTGATGPGVRQGIETIFQPSHPFIQAIKERLRQLSKK